LKALRDAERDLPWKLRLNAFLNGAGRKGSRTANGIAALVLLYSAIETASWGGRQKQDGWNIVAGTTLAPIIYWSGGIKRMTFLLCLVLTGSLPFLLSPHSHTAGWFKCLAFGLMGAITGAGLVVGQKYNFLGLRKVLPVEE